MEEQKVQAPAENKGVTKKVKIVNPPVPAIEEVYVDGIAGIMGRGGVFKLDCYRVDGVERETEAEVRRISHRLVLPASSMGELIQIVQGVMKTAVKNKEK